MAVEVKALHFGREAALQKKWLQIWKEIGKRVLKLPNWMQDIVLDDINTAIKNRIAIMEIIQNAKRTN